MRVRSTAAALILSFLMPVAALANGASADFPAGGIVFKQEPGIAIAREDLFVSPGEIRVRYVFQSSLEKSVSRTIGFPLPRVMQDDSPDNVTTYASYEDAEDPENYMPFEILVNGAAVDATRHEFAWDGDRNLTTEFEKLGVPFFVASEDRRAALENLPKDVLAKLEADKLVNVYSNIVEPLWQYQAVYEWQQLFEHGETIVEVRYQPLIGYATATDARFLDDGLRAEYCVTGSFTERRDRMVAEIESRDGSFPEVATLGYILTTAKNWSGPIGEFHLEVAEDENSLASFCAPAGLKEDTEAAGHWMAQDFVPERDLAILYILSFTSE